jgi:hypothetical protein
MLLAALVLAGACAGPKVASPSPLPTATQAPTQESTSTASTRPTFETPGAPTTLSPEEICAEVQLLEDAIYLGECNGVITVGVRAGAEELARELRAKYGDAIELSVGLFPYPPPDDPQRACLSIRPTVIEHPPLVAAVEVDRVIVAGTDFEGKVRLTNAGPVPFELETSSNFSLYLFRPGEPDPIGMSELGSMGTGYGATLAPGASIRLLAIGGTASCDLALGYTLPPDVYEARALVDFERDPEEGAEFFWSDPTPVEVVNP